MLFKPVTTRAQSFRQFRKSALPTAYARYSTRHRLRAAPACLAGVTAPQESRKEVQAFLDGLKWDKAGLITVTAQDIDTGEVLMQAFSDRAGIQETLHTRLATFYSRSRGERWCKGETSGNYIHVDSIFFDCDKDSVIYLGEPDGPSCHTGASTCWYLQAAVDAGEVLETGDQLGRSCSPLPSLLSLEHTIAQRRAQSTASTGNKPSWTAKLLQDPTLLCSKIREEAGELCETLETGESRDRTVSEMADLLYHSMVLLNARGVSLKEVCGALRARFAQSGVEEKAGRTQQAIQIVYLNRQFPQIAEEQMLGTLT